MIEKMSVSLIKKMLEENLIDEGKSEHYRCVIISMADQFIAIGTIILISVIANTVIPAFFFSDFFLSIEKTNRRISRK